MLSVLLHLSMLGGLRDFEPLRLADAPRSRQVVNASLSSPSTWRSGVDKALVVPEALSGAQTFKQKRLASKIPSAISAVQPSRRPFVEKLTAESPDQLVEVPRSVAVKPGQESPDNSADAEGLRIYRLSLAREARRYKVYPAIARERAWQGEVVVDISTRPGLRAPVVTLSQTSGHAVLDAQAVAMMESAARQASVPESLRGKRLVISLPISYRLDD